MVGAQVSELMQSVSLGSRRGLGEEVGHRLFRCVLIGQEIASCVLIGWNAKSVPIGQKAR